MATQVVIVNPNSAGGQTRQRWPRMEATLRDALGPFQALFTERPGHATELARRALRDGADVVISMGGDGTLNEVVNGFFEDGEAGNGTSRAVRPGAAFGLLPAGTGGDFPKTIGTPRALDDAARAIASGRARPIDVGRIEFVDNQGKKAVRHFINITTIGIGGLVDRYVNSSSKALGGKASFLIATLRAALAYTNAPVRLRLDDGPAQERTIYTVAVANGKFAGGGMKLAPDAALDDGQFDVVTIDGISMATATAHMSKLYQGTHVKLPFVTVARARRLTAEPVRGDDEVLLDVDGEQPGRLPATFTVLPGAIQVMTAA